jgi:hypothetical protein
MARGVANYPNVVNSIIPQIHVGQFTTLRITVILLALLLGVYVFSGRRRQKKVSVSVKRRNSFHH